jgi:hypothetical protein
MEKYTLRSPGNGVSGGFVKGFTRPVRLDQRTEFVPLVNFNSEAQQV